VGHHITAPHQRLDLRPHEWVRRVESVAVIAARLRTVWPDLREGASEKQETPRPASQRVSTAPIRSQLDGRAASAQSDRSH
jgi:hypothetical protein